MRIPIEQDTTDIDQRIHDFMDRKASPWRKISQKVAERLVPTVYRRTAGSGGIYYEVLRWRH